MAQLRSKRKAPDATMPEENLNPISCELCRQRKCKCDRKLPFCSQCAGDVSKCIYPESGKRGLPLGYLNQLEERLAETESALYGALMAMRSMGQPIVIQTPKTDTLLKHKAARMKEWSQLPLRESPDMERWLTVMSDRFTIEQSSDVVSDTPGRGYAVPMTPSHDKSQPSGDQPHSGLVSYAWQKDNRVSSVSSYDAHQPHPGVIASQAYFGDQVAVGPESIMPSPGSSRDGITSVEDAVGISVDANASAGPSKAEELSHNNPRLYF
ncbi:transcriptional regulator family: Fungal Specific TF [Penicillium roqueforti]|nr:transcriptional regulator family: Fungal Specific TF [Penicillium roqueforti]